MTAQMRAPARSPAQRLAPGRPLRPDTWRHLLDQSGYHTTVTIGPDDADYERFAQQAVTQEEFDERRRRWQEGDEPLRRQFLDFLARHGNPGRIPDGDDH